MAQDDAVEEPAAETAAATEESADGGLSAAQKRLEDLDKQVMELKDVSKSFTARYERYKKEVQERLKKAEEGQQKASELRAEYDQFLKEPYTFHTIPEEKRNEYEETGTALMNEVVALLRGKEPDQIAGVIKFEKVQAEYQGIPGYTAALEQYKKVTDRLEKKWSAARDRITKERQKYSPAMRQKVEDAEQAAYKRQEQKMESAGKDISRDWFVPTSTMTANLPLLEALLQRVRAAKRAATTAPAPEAGKVTNMLQEYWNSVDELVQQMRDGHADKAIEMLNDNKNFQDLSMTHRSCMPEQFRQDLRTQNSELKSDMRKRLNDARSRERAIQRVVSDSDRELRYAESRLDAIAEDIDREKEEMARKAEEEAERKAEEEAERLAAEEEAAEDEAAEEPAPKKSKKKRKKKSAEKKTEEAED